ELALRLVPGGLLEVATDHEEYALAIAEVLAAEPLLENRAAPAAFRRTPPARAPTAYELEWQAQGRPAHYFSYARSAAPAAPPGRPPGSAQPAQAGGRCSEAGWGPARGTPPPPPGAAAAGAAPPGAWPRPPPRPAPARPP